MTRSGARAFVTAARAELDPVLARLGLAFDRREDDPRGVELRYASDAAEVIVRWDAAGDEVTAWAGPREEDLVRLTDGLRRLGDDQAAERLERLAAPGCETGVRVAEHARVLAEHGSKLLSR